jgi:hypothetical protein
MTLEGDIRELRDGLTVTSAQSLLHERRLKDHRQWMEGMERAFARMAALNQINRRIHRLPAQGRQRPPVTIHLSIRDSLAAPACGCDDVPNRPAQQGERQQPQMPGISTPHSDAQHLVRAFVPSAGPQNQRSQGCEGRRKKECPPKPKRAPAETAPHAQGRGQEDQEARDARRKERVHDPHQDRQRHVPENDVAGKYKLRPLTVNYNQAE